MASHAVQVDPGEILPVLARLYECSEHDFAQTLPQLTAAWLVQDSGGRIAGAIGLRPSPSHGAEVMGGAFSGAEQNELAMVLMLAALKAQPHLYAYAEAHLLPAGALKAAGLQRVGAYTRLAGPLPTLPPTVPEGFQIIPLSEAHSPQDRLTAQRMYSDRIGHTHVPDEAAQPSFGGSDGTLGRLAYDALGSPAGICRAWLEGGLLALGTPGVRPDLRDTKLRRALLLSVCQAARAAGTVRLELDAWGDTEAEQAVDLELGLSLKAETPIYSSVPLYSSYHKKTIFMTEREE